MTLLINDIFIPGDLRAGYILTVADTRISYKKKDGKYPAPTHAKKIFDIPYLNATAGYFGLAYYQYIAYVEELSSWLNNFINKNHQAETMGDFSRALCKELNLKMPKHRVKEQITGFHICGYNKDDIPEFWIVRNSGDDYKKPPLDHYLCDEKFLSGEATAAGFDGTNPNIGKYQHSFYINGDPDPFHRIWLSLGDFVDGMIEREDFTMEYNPLEGKSDDDISKIAKWQMKVIGSFYSNFAKEGRKIVGGPPDTLIVRPKNPPLKRRAIYLEGGLLNGIPYDLNDHSTKVIRALVEMKNTAGRFYLSPTFTEIEPDEPRDYDKFVYYRRTGRTKQDLMVVFEPIEPE